MGTECYKVAGEKRYFYFSFEHWQKNTDGSYAAQNLRRIRVGLGKFMPSYYKKLASDFGKKYKEKYRLTIEQSIGLNKGNLITFFEDARVTLLQVVDTMKNKMIGPKSKRNFIIIYSTCSLEQ